eukprot:357392-Chlamydomonas_euryale.AAC.13
MSGKSRLSHIRKPDNLRRLRDSVIRDRVRAESDVPHVPAECLLPAQVDRCDRLARFGICGKTCSGSKSAGQSMGPAGHPPETSRVPPGS